MTKTLAITSKKFSDSSCPIFNKSRQNTAKKSRFCIFKHLLHLLNCKLCLKMIEMHIKMWILQIFFFLKLYLFLALYFWMKSKDACIMHVHIIYVCICLCIWILIQMNIWPKYTYRFYCNTEQFTEFFTGVKFLILSFSS